MPRSCAASSASAICRAIASASPIRQGASGGGAADHLRQRLTFDEFEDERVYAVMLFQPVNGGDVAMIERGKCPGFALESRQPIGIGSKRGRQDLQGHVSAKLEVVGAVDLAHPADAEEGRDLIRAEVSASRQRHVRGRRFAGLYVS